MEGTGSNPEVYLDNAIRAVREKKQVPEIDFTIHEMEDGSQVNTQERVCKGESPPSLQRRGVLNRAYHLQTDY
jgi:serine/threonine-protein phosphatase 2B catalytic subunit